MRRSSRVDWQVISAAAVFAVLEVLMLLGGLGYLPCW